MAAHIIANSSQEEVLHHQDLLGLNFNLLDHHSALPADLKGHRADLKVELHQDHHLALHLPCLKHKALEDQVELELMQLIQVR
jgi:hypothetical protein